MGGEAQSLDKINERIPNNNSHREFSQAGNQLQTPE
jgi:hypothetical protein